MIAHSQPIPVDQSREFGFDGRNRRFSVQRTQSQNFMYPSPPQGSPPQFPGFPRGDFPEWSTSPPVLPPNATVTYLPPLPGSAFHTGVPVYENVNSFAQQHQYFDLRDETPSPPLGFPATSVRGFAGSPPYPMPLRMEYSPPSNAQSSDRILNSTPPQYKEAGGPQVLYQQQMYTTQFQASWPQNQFSRLPAYPLTFFPSSPAMSAAPCGVNGCGCFPPPPQREEFFANNLPLFRPMPMANLMDPSYLGTMQEVAEPPPMPVPDNEDNGNANRSRRIRKRRTRGKSANVASDNQVMKMSEQDNWRLDNRRRSTSTPAICFNFCSFCKSNRETRQFFLSHVLKNDDGVTTCPILRKYTCPICNAVGDNAHTLKYCPENQDGALGSRERSVSLSSQKKALKKKRNSRGIIGAYRYG